MNRLEDIFSDFKKAVAVSAGIHLLVLLVFLGIGVGIDFTPSEFAEIGFVTSSRAARVSPPVQRTQPVQQPRPQQIQRPPEPQQTTPPKAEPVNLPKRRMLEDEEPVISNRESGKLTPTSDNTRIKPTDQVYQGRQLRQDISGTRVNDQVPSTVGGDQSADRTEAPTTDVGPVGTQQPYSIEGDAAKRAILNKLIPQYPPGLQREAVVRIRFFVLPDGSVGQMIPVQKGDPVLEDITMSALRQWRFNPLPPGAEQKNVMGVITFRYELQ